MKAKHHPLILMIAFWSIALGSSAHAQPTQSLIARGGLENRRDASYVAYLDTVRHVARFYQDFRRGQTIKGKCMAIDEWNGVVIFHMRDHCLLASKANGIFNNEGIKCSLEGENLLLFSIHWVHFYKKGFERITSFPNPSQDNFKWQVADTLAGERVLCLAELKRKDHLTASELHTWGMITPEGKWRIEPKFDAPFHFENGVAAVLYYGEKRRINEQGEFID